jgi:hypothetical protein
MASKITPTECGGAARCTGNLIPRTLVGFQRQPSNLQIDTLSHKESSNPQWPRRFCLNNHRRSKSPEEKFPCWNESIRNR